MKRLAFIGILLLITATLCALKPPMSSFVVSSSTSYWAKPLGGGWDNFLSLMEELQNAP